MRKPRSIGNNKGRIINNKIIKPSGKKSTLSEAVSLLEELRSYLTIMEPELVILVVTLLKNQGKAITYKELREALVKGDISPSILDQWREDYGQFIVEKLLPRWLNAMKAATAKLEAKFPEWYFDPMGEGVSKWTEKHSAELVTNITNAQMEGLRAVIRKAAVLEDMSVDGLSRVIRPMVGLTRPQSIANLNYYITLLANGLKEEKAQDLAIRYAARQQRYRAYNIARTELAMAYNMGAHEGTRQAQAAGYLGQMVKIWSTAEDERQCSYCRALEGAIVGMEEEFQYPAGGNKFTGLVPPAHPSCRCAVLYKEIAPPKNAP